MCARTGENRNLMLTRASLFRNSSALAELASTMSVRWKLRCIGARVNATVPSRTYPWVKRRRAREKILNHSHQAIDSRQRFVTQNLRTPKPTLKQALGPKRVIDERAKLAAYTWDFDPPSRSSPLHGCCP